MKTYKRDYKKQALARDLKYKRFEVNVEELEGLAFKDKLRENNTNFMEWARSRIKDYMKEGK